MDWRPSETIGDNRGELPLLIHGRSLAGLACLRPLWGSRPAQPVPLPIRTATSWPRSVQGRSPGPSARLGPGASSPPHQLPSGKGGVSPNRFADTQILVTYPGRLRPSHPPRLRPTDVCFHNCRASSQRAAPLIDGKTHSLEAFIGSEGAILKVSRRTTGRLPDPENNYLREGG